MSQPSNQYRYPGINAFEETQKDRFHGRSVESEQLCALLTQEKLTILFGKSGYGKTSLLNAGVRPLLLEKSAKSKRRYHPVSIRFNAYNGEESLLDKFKRQFSQAAAAIGMTPAAHGVALPETLWGIVRGHAFPAGSPAAVFVLLFDQFEEFFTYPLEQQQDFKDQLAELLYTDYPHFLEQNEARLQADQIAALAEPLDVRALFSVRADRMHEMNRLADRLDKILHNLYELQALPRAEAEKAIVLPATLPQSEGYAGAPFVFDRPALDRILDFLADAQGRVEANQLQILCDSFEQRTIGENITRFGTDNIGDLQQVISNYYHHKIADIQPPETRLAVQRLCEEGLAMEGEPPLRLSLHEAQISRLFGVPPSLLLRLVDLRLLRAEAGAGGGAVYELPHDTLLLPVLEAKRVRQEEMAKEAERVAAEEALRRAKEAEAQADKERRRRQQATTLAIAAVVGLLLALAAMFWAFSAQKQAEAAKKEAQDNLNALKEENRIRVEAQDINRRNKIEALKNKIRGFIKDDKSDKYNLARDSLKVLERMAPNDPDLQSIKSQLK
ncbi:MAG: hypothetical protein WCR52_21485 [Bacteroidota bacterium]